MPAMCDMSVGADAGSGSWVHSQVWCRSEWWRLSFSSETEENADRNLDGFVECHMIAGARCTVVCCLHGTLVHVFLCAGLRFCSSDVSMATKTFVNNTVLTDVINWIVHLLWIIVISFMDFYMPLVYTWYGNVTCTCKFCHWFSTS